MRLTRSVDVRRSEIRKKAVAFNSPQHPLIYALDHALLQGITQVFA